MTWNSARQSFVPAKATVFGFHLHKKHGRKEIRLCFLDADSFEELVGNLRELRCQIGRAIGVCLLNNHMNSDVFEAAWNRDLFLPLHDLTRLPRPHFVNFVKNAFPIMLNLDLGKEIKVFTKVFFLIFNMRINGETVI